MGGGFRGLDMWFLGWDEWMAVRGGCGSGGCVLGGNRWSLSLTGDKSQLAMDTRQCRWPREGEGQQRVGPKVAGTT